MKTIEIKKILVPTDFSETANTAMAHGAYLAWLFKAKLFLFHNIEPDVSIIPVFEPIASTVYASDKNYTAKKSIETVADSLEKKYEIEVITITDNAGRPALGIADAVKENDIDIIVMGTHGVNGAGEYFIGNNAHKVVTLAPCPVITIPSAVKNIGFNNIVLPIDESLYSRQKVNDVILLASKYKSTVNILGLVEEDDETSESKMEIKVNSVEQALKKEHIPFTRKIVRATNVAAETMKYSKKIIADLIVIMTDHESEISGIFLGIFAKQIINHSPIPVMSIKPIAGNYSFESFTGGI